MIPRLPLWLLLVALLGCSSLCAQTDNGKDSLSCAIHYESVKLQKQLSDEYFINNRDSVARQGYMRSLQELGYLEINLICPYKDSINLLKQEILYRLFLLNEHLGFWGAAQLQPLNPVFYYNQFMKEQKEFEDLAKEIEGYLKDIDLAADVADADVSNQDLQTVNAQIEVINREKIDLYNDFYGNMIAQYKQRLTELHDRQMTIEATVKAKMSELEKVNGNLTSVMMQGLSQAIGLPFDPQLLLSESSLKDKLLQVGQQLIVNDPSIKKAVGELSTTMNDLMVLYAKADSLVNEGKNMVETARGAYKVIREPTLDNFLEIGQKVMGKLAAEDLAKIKATIGQAKSLETVFHLVKDQQAIKQKLVNEVFKNKAVLQTYVNNVVAEKSAQIALFSAIASQYLASATDASRQYILTKFMHLYPLDFIAALPAQARAELARVLGNLDQNALLDKIKTYQFGVDQAITISGLQLSVQQEQITADASQWLQSVAQKVDGLPQAAREELTAIITDMVEERLGEFSKSLKQSLDLFDVENALSAIFKDLAPEQLAVQRDQYYLQITASLSSLPEFSSLEQQLLASSLGAYVANGTSPKPDFKYQPQPSPGALNKSQQFQRMAVTAALSYACPYVGMAIAFINAFNKRSKLIDEIRALESENKALTAKKLVMLDMLDHTYLQQRLVEKDRSINNLRKNYADKAYYQIRAKLASSTNRIGQYRIKVANRKPLLFYRAEKLREYAQMLDLALLFRHGQTFPQMVLSNPSNMRHMLDDEINLGSWLDLSRAGIRSDLDKMRVQWKEYAALLQSDCKYCPEQKIPDLDPEQSSSISLKESFGLEWNDLLQAITRHARSYNLRMPIMPGPGAVLNDSLKNMRFLDVRVIAVMKNGTYRSIQNATLAHPGISYIFDGERFQKELFPATQLVSVVSGIEQQPDVNAVDYPQAFNTNDYRQRWKTVGDRQNDGRLVAYGLFTEWTLQLPITSNPSVLSAGLEDIRIRFIYSYDPVPTQPVKGHAALLNPAFPQVLKTFTTEDFKMFNEPQACERRVEYLFKQYANFW